MTFDGDMIRNLPYVVTFELTYLPLVFAVLVALVWGPLGGSLAVVTLAFMVLYQSGQEKALSSPRQSLAGLAGHPGLPGDHRAADPAGQHAAQRRAQSLERAEQWRGRFELALAGSHQLMYRYNPQDGSLELAGDVRRRWARRPMRCATWTRCWRAPIRTTDRACPCTGPRAAGTQDMTPLLFRLAHGAGGWRLISDKGSPLADFDGSVAVVAGMWRLGEMEPGTGDVR